MISSNYPTSVQALLDRMPLAPLGMGTPHTRSR